MSKTPQEPSLQIPTLVPLSTYMLIDTVRRETAKPKAAVIKTLLFAGIAAIAGDTTDPDTVRHRIVDQVLHYAENESGRVANR